MGFVILVPAFHVAAAVGIFNAPVALVQAFGFAYATDHEVPVALSVVAASRTLLAAVVIAVALITQSGASIRLARIVEAASIAFAAVVEIDAGLILSDAARRTIADGGGGEDRSDRKLGEHFDSFLIL